MRDAILSSVLWWALLWTANCVHVYERLKARVAEWGAMLLADDEGSITHQVHAVSSVEDSIFMESSHGQLFLDNR